MQNINNKLFEILKKKNFYQDKKAKSLSFFCKEQIKSNFLDKSLIDIMKKISLKYKIDLRLNLHSSPKDNHHDMIILQRKNYKCEIHKHTSNGETIHIIEGSLNVVLYDEKKKLISKISLSKNKNIIYRIPIKCYHKIEITSLYAIYHENKKGPFIRSQTILY